MNSKNPRKSKVKKRKPRAKFRPSFRDRCVYSFQKCLTEFSEIQEILDEEDDDDSEILGMTFIGCYKALSHSIEMLCKATLAQRSIYLVLQDISHFDSLFPRDSAVSENSCGAVVALARASKIFRRSLSNAELGRLKEIASARNQAEHNEFFIKDFTKEVHNIISAFQIVVETYNTQFRSGDLIEESKRFGADRVGVDVAEVYNRAIRESSEEFKRVEAMVAKLAKGGMKFIRCYNCYYPFAQLESGGKAYKCLWCDDARVKRVCVVSTCKKEFWASADDSSVKCSDAHIEEIVRDYFPIDRESSEFKAFASTLESAQSAMAIASDHLRQSLDYRSDWFERPANPKIIEEESDNSGGDDKKPSKT